MLITIIVLQTLNGYAISVATYNEIPSAIVTLIMEKHKVAPDVIAELLHYFEGTSESPRHWSKLSSPTGLEKATQEVVAKYDVDILQPSRNSWQALIDSPKNKIVPMASGAAGRFQRPGTSSPAVTIRLRRRAM
jgi:hypothetical protein